MISVEVFAERASGWIAQNLPAVTLQARAGISGSPGRLYRRRHNRNGTRRHRRATTGPAQGSSKRRRPVPRRAARPTSKRRHRMTGPRQALLGGRLLESFVSRDADTGVESHPTGDRPCGLILYTSAGYMSAPLTSHGDAEYIAYAGRFDVDEKSSTVRHNVLTPIMPELLTQSQLRHALIDDDRLTLSTSVTSAAGKTTHSTLVWRQSPGIAAPAYEHRGRFSDR